MSDKVPCDLCGDPVDLGDYAIYHQATGIGMCSDCYFHELAVGHGKRDWDRRVELAEALFEADDLAEYFHDKWVDEVRLQELDEQGEKEGH